MNKLKKIKKTFIDILFVLVICGGMAILFYLLWWADTQDFQVIYTMRGLDNTPH